MRALIAGTEQVFKWALFDRPPLETWTRGRVTLLGDAAHPMLPFMGQGAAQSIEDGFVLARCLAADRDDPQRAIEAYAARRRERTAAVQAASRDASRVVQLTRPGRGRRPATRGCANSPEAPSRPVRLDLGLRRGTRDGRRLGGVALHGEALYPAGPHQGCELGCGRGEGGLRARLTPRAATPECKHVSSMSALPQIW